MERKKKVYRNYLRSEKAIIRAYAELMREKGSSKITVTDIVTRADLNRSTFYTHFTAADEVRERIHSDVIYRLQEAIKNDDSRNSLSDPRQILGHIFGIIDDDEEMYKTLLCTDGASEFLKRLKDMLVDWYLSDEVSLPQIENRDEFEMILRLFIGGIISVLRDWAEGDIHISMQRAQDMMETLIKRVAKIYLED